MDRGDVPKRGIQRLGYTGNPWIFIRCWRGSGQGFRQGLLGGKWLIRASKSLAAWESTAAAAPIFEIAVNAQV